MACDVRRRSHAALVRGLGIALAGFVCGAGAQAQGDLDLERIHIERLDARGDAGMGSTLALDAQDRPHIAYYGTEGCCDTALKYAFRDAADWSFEVLVPSVGALPADARASLALDADGQPHIAYYDASARSLRYLRRTEAGWQAPETADGGPEAGQFASLALDAQGNPHIAYYDAANGDLRYVRKSGAGAFLAPETVDAAGDVGRYASLGLLGSDPHIAYHDATNGDLRYVRKNGGGAFLAPETVDSDGTAGVDASLAFDGQGHPGISHVSPMPFSTARTLKFALKTGASWAPETIKNFFPASARAGGTSLRFDGTGAPYIGFASDSTVTYVHKAGVQWLGKFPTATDDQDPGTRGARSPSIALAQDGTVRIAYFKLDHSDLKFYSVAAGWQIHRIQQDASATANRPSLALHDGLARISYVGQNEQDGDEGLYLATQDPNGFSISDRIWPEDPLTSVDAISSLALDAQGLARISFYFGGFCDPSCDTPMDLMFAYLDGSDSTWKVETVATAGDVGRFNRLFLDANDVPSIVYSDATNGQIRIARRVPIGQNSATPWQILPAALTVTIDAGDFSGSALALPDGSIAVSHHEVPARAGSGTLRLGIWDGALWNDQLIDDGADPNAVSEDVGGRSALAYDAAAGRIAVAYTSTEFYQKYAYQADDGTWVRRDLCLVGADEFGFRLELGLLEGSSLLPRISMVFDGGAGTDALDVATGADLCGELLDVANRGFGVSSVVDDREHIAYASQFGQLRYAVRTIAAPQPPAEAQPVTEVFDFLSLVRAYCGVARSPLAGWLASQERGNLNICGCTCTRAARGQRGGSGGPDLQQFCTLVPELERIYAAEPELLQDTYATLQDLVPGRDAVQQGRGNEVRLTQDHVDDVKSILDRLRQEGSPELIAEVDGLYDQYNDLQDFPGKTFDQAASMVGVTVSGQVGLPGEPLVVLAVSLLLTVRFRRARRAIRTRR